MARDLDNDELDRDRVCAIALRLIDLGWFRVGSDRHTRTSGTFGITTLRKRHVAVRGNRIRLEFVGKGRSQVRTSLVDDELATAIRELLAARGRGRLFRYERNGNGVCDLTSRTLNEYVKTNLGPEFSAKDFRTWGGTLVAAIAFAERNGDGKGAVTAVMRQVADRLGNTPAVCRQSYVAPAVVDAYLEGRTIADFRPRHLRIVGARQTGLEPEEAALLALLNFE
jgi:DNA topoisomerase IB